MTNYYYIRSSEQLHHDELIWISKRCASPPVYGYMTHNKEVATYYKLLGYEVTYREQ